MTNYRNIITVDGHQVAILGVEKELNPFQLAKIKRKFAEERNIPLGLQGYGVGLVFKRPKMRLDIWHPE